MKVLFSEEAEQDLEDAVSYLLEQNPAAAGRLIESVFDLAQRLAEGRFDGPWQVLSDGRCIQSWPLPPYRLFYQRAQDSLIVLRVYHQQRRPL